jgi:hypothetical protein
MFVVDDFDKCVIRNLKSVGIIWRKCQLKRKILVERADIVTWRSRYLKEIQECQDNGHLMFYMHQTWTDSNLTLSVCAEYIYSTASHANRPDGVLILRNLHKVVK